MARFLLLLFSFALLSDAWAANGPRRVEFWPQVHGVSKVLRGGLSPEYLEVADRLAMESQYDIAVELVRQHTKAVVFAEGLGESVLEELARQKSQTRESLFKGSFLSSIMGQTPKDFSTIDLGLKDLMLLSSGAIVPWTMDLIELKASQSDVEMIRLMAKVNKVMERTQAKDEAFNAELFTEPGMQEEIMEGRERIALQQISNYIKLPESKNKELILIFGAAHDFSSVAKEFPEISLVRRGDMLKKCEAGVIQMLSARGIPVPPDFHL